MPRPARRCRSRYGPGLPRRADRPVPARPRQAGPRLLVGQPAEGGARRGVRHPRAAVGARRADQRPGPADGARVPGLHRRRRPARPDRLPELAQAGRGGGGLHAGGHPAGRAVGGGRRAGGPASAAPLGGRRPPRPARTRAAAPRGAAGGGRSAVGRRPAADALAGRRRLVPSCGRWPTPMWRGSTSASPRSRRSSSTTTARQRRDRRHDPPPGPGPDGPRRLPAATRRRRSRRRRSARFDEGRRSSRSSAAAMAAIVVAQYRGLDGALGHGIAGRARGEPGDPHPVRPAGRPRRRRRLHGLADRDVPRRPRRHLGGADRHPADPGRGGGGPVGPPARRPHDAPVAGGPHAGRRPAARPPSRGSRSGSPWC